MNPIPLLIAELMSKRHRHVRSDSSSRRYFFRSGYCQAIETTAVAVAVAVAVNDHVNDHVNVNVNVNVDVSETRIGLWPPVNGIGVRRRGRRAPAHPRRWRGRCRGRPPHRT